MAVSVNTVYRTVLYILNKEQRGYVTPTEFNSVASQVQREIFQSYFPDGNQVNRLNQNNTQNETEFFNIFDNISYKLYPFEQSINFRFDTGYSTSTDTFVPTVRSQVYKIGEVVSNYAGQPSRNSITQLVSSKEFNKITRSNLTAPTQSHPLLKISNSDITPLTAEATIPLPTNNSATAVVNITSGSIGPGNTIVGTGVTSNAFVQSFNSSNNTLTFNTPQTLAAGVNLTFFGATYNDLSLTVNPTPNSITVNGLIRPTDPVWGFTLGNVGQYLYNSATSVDFMLDNSERTNIVLNMLKYFGIIINNPLVIQSAEQEIQKTGVNEKS